MKPQPEITREQIEATKHTMVRRFTHLSLTARAILAELISYDYLSRETGTRKGEVWVSQGTLASNLGVSRDTININIKQVVSSPFVKSIRKFKTRSGCGLAYVLDWEAINKHTLALIEKQGGCRKSRQGVVGNPDIKS